MLHILGLLFWLVIIPYCIGLIPANFISEDKRNPGFVMLAGYFMMWALFEVVTIPAVIFLKYDNFKVASVSFTISAVLCAAAGLMLTYRTVRKKKLNPTTLTNTDVSESDINVSWIKLVASHIGTLSWAERIEWLLFFVLLGFQLYKAAAYASFDGDDAYYVVESLIAQQAGVMYRILPYTGRSTGLDIRHMLAVFPIWIAFIGVKSDIHTTVVSHLVMPFVLIPLSYLVYYEIGKVLFRTKPEEQDSLFHRENLPIFMIIMALFQVFGNVSIYTSETFFLTRTWQGKAVAGSLVIPALLLMFLWIYSDAGRKSETGAKAKRYGDAGQWMMLVGINTTAGICSSLAVFLACILMAITASCLALTERDYKVIVKMGAVCIPHAIYIAIYLFVGYSHLWI